MELNIIDEIVLWTEKIEEIEIKSDKWEVDILEASNTVNEVDQLLKFFHSKLLIYLSDKTDINKKILKNDSLNIFHLIRKCLKIENDILKIIKIQIEDHQKFLENFNKKGWKNLYYNQLDFIWKKNEEVNYHLKKLLKIFKDLLMNFDEREKYILVYENEVIRKYLEE